MENTSKIYNHVSEINQLAYELLYKNNIPIFVKFELLEVEMPKELRQEFIQIVGFSEIYLERHQSNLKNRLSICNIMSSCSFGDKKPKGE